MTSVNNVCLCRHDSCHTFVVRLHRVLFVSTLCSSPAGPSGLRKTATVLGLLQGWWWERVEGVLAPQQEAGWAFTHACCAANILRNLAMEPRNLPALTGVSSPCTHTPQCGPSSKLRLLTVYPWPTCL